MKILRLLPLFLALSLAVLIGCAKQGGGTSTPKSYEAPPNQDPDSPVEDGMNRI